MRTTHQSAVAENRDTYPFGEQWIAGLPGDQHRYTGHLRDAEDSNDYAGARYDSNVRGRWLSPDPVLEVRWFLLYFSAPLNQASLRPGFGFRTILGW